MGPMVWWWRWWLGMDPNRAGELTETGGQTEEQQAAAAELSAQLEARDDEVQQLREQLHAQDGERQDAEQLRAELERSRADVDTLRAELDQRRADAEELRARLAELEARRREQESAPPDLAEAKAVLGSAVALDDLTVVEGVGPKIAGLLADAGIDTWRALADSDVEHLRKVLDEAGSRYRMHDPTTWPRQAALLAEGRWREFKDLTDD